MANIDENEAWLERFQRTTATCAFREHDPAYGPVFVSGKGAWLTDVNGQSWLDLTCGFSATNFGHAFLPLVEAARTQIGCLTHLTSEPHVGRIRLAEKLLSVLDRSQPTSERRVVFNASGSRAVESAWKAAREFRPGKLLVLMPSFHGRSIATSAISQTVGTAVSRAVESEVWRWPAEEYPYCARCPLGLAFPACQLACSANLLHVLADQAKHISAVLVEPVLTARGYVFPPAEFFHKLRRLTAELGITLISDEIQAGLGRCGALCMAEAQGWQPDLAVWGKSLGGGIAPISAVTGRAELLNAIPSGAESETFAATPLACAVAEQVLDLLVHTDIMADGRDAGEQLRERARASLPDCLVEGQGAVCVLEFGLPQVTLEIAQQAAQHFALACREHRLRVQLSGPVMTRIVMLPPLNITAGDLAAIPWEMLGASI